jgi:hypothetical protein
MPSWLKLILVALAAFGFGFTAASRFPPVGPTSAEKVGITLRLGAKTPGESYLIVQGGAGKADPFSRAASPAGSWPRWTVKTTEHITLNQLPIAVYQSVPIRSLLYKCVGADCPPPPDKPPSRGTRFILLTPGPG